MQFQVTAGFSGSNPSKVKEHVYVVAHINEDSSFPKARSETQTRKEMLSLTQAATSFSQKRTLCLTHCFQRRSSVALRWYCSPGMEMFAGTESDRSLGFIISPSQTTKRLQSKLKNLCFFLRKYCKFPPWEQFASWPCRILPNLLATLHSPITWIRNKNHLCLFSHT